MASDLKLGMLQVTPADASMKRFTQLLWGSVGCGKTELASTAPKPILWLQFDPDAVAGIGQKDGISVVDFSGSGHMICKDFVERGMMEQQLDALIKATSGLRTIVFDSATSYAGKALNYAVASGKADGKGFRASMEQPGIAGYGIRNRVVLDTIMLLFRVTSRHALNFIVICHEGSADKDEQGNVVSITLMLGGSLPAEMPLHFSEVWYMSERDRKRTLRYRPFLQYKPMRSRMFDMSAEGRFEWVYDPITGIGMKLETWFDAWKAGGFKKMECPK